MLNQRTDSITQCMHLWPDHYCPMRVQATEGTAYTSSQPHPSTRGQARPINNGCMVQLVRKHSCARASQGRYCTQISGKACREQQACSGTLECCQRCLKFGMNMGVAAYQSRRSWPCRTTAIHLYLSPSTFWISLARPTDMSQIYLSAASCTAWALATTDTVLLQYGSACGREHVVSPPPWRMVHSVMLSLTTYCTLLDGSKSRI